MDLRLTHRACHLMTKIDPNGPEHAGDNKPAYVTSTRASAQLPVNRTVQAAFRQQDRSPLSALSYSGHGRISSSAGTIAR
jgi:hypothetical protein